MRLLLIAPNQSRNSHLPVSILKGAVTKCVHFTAHGNLPATPGAVDFGRQARETVKSLSGLMSTEGEAPPRPPTLLSGRALIWIALAMAIGVAHLACGKNRPTGPDTTPPAAVGSFSSSVQGSDTVLLTWTAPGDDGISGKASTYDARVSANVITPVNFADADTLGSPPAPATAGSAQQMYATNIPGNSTRYFALRVADEQGNWSPISSLGPIHTPPDTIPPGAITALNWDAVSDTSVTVAWRSSGDDGSRGTASSYDLRVSSSIPNESNWRAARQVSELPPPQVAGSPQRKIVSGLLPGRTYFFAMHVEDEAGNLSSLSNILGIKTAPRSKPRTWVVAQDGTGNSPSIQAAVDSSIDGDSVAVRPGIYYENVRVFGKGVRIGSQGGPEVTTIDGSRQALSVVHVRGPATRSTSICGFTIRGGVGSPQAGPGLERFGGGILIENEPCLISRNVIRDNGILAPPQWGGGVYVTSGSALSAPIYITENFIFNNKAHNNGGGIGFHKEVNLRIVGNSVFQNDGGEGDGGGIWGLPIRESTEIRGNHIYKNHTQDHGGGLYIGSAEVVDITVTGNIVDGNVADGHEGADGTGGGVWLAYCSGRVENNTIVANTGNASTPCGMGQLALENEVQVQVRANVIAFASVGTGITCAHQPQPYLKYNVFWANPLGSLCESCNPAIMLDTTNVVMDPEFCDLDGDLRGVAEKSPLVTSPIGVIGASPYVYCGEAGKSRVHHCGTLTRKESK